ncbi:mucin-5AC-like isoform X2 [Mizuhopecten yessoensis]|uniref:mucin-5AC-like isoform X2 n=1 Tax=Mizuhopecten yessoensis TaxID=6573 RepID=UPI000B45CD1B|nr:mucin-5AC-like isoform X2 [Mizuhopecten yessoensis]
MYSKGRKIGINIAGKLKKKLGDTDEKEQGVQSQGVVGDTVSPGMKATPPVQHLNKSISLGSIHNDSSDGAIVDQDDIINLTHNVKRFSDGLARLKGVFGECSESGDELRHRTHERLGEVLYTLKNILQSYPILQSTELFAASGALISKVKSFDYVGTSSSSAELHFSEAIDQLALVFSSSVSEYLMGDQDTSFQEKTEKAKSYDGLASTPNRTEEVPDADDSSKSVAVLTSESVDSCLCELQAGVDVALQRAKVWSKYMKDVTSYIERKAQLETDYSKNLGRLAQTMKPILTEEAFLPLQSVYCTVLQQDKDYASTCQATQTLLQASKFVEPLTARRLEHDKERKTIKDSWLKEVKRMQDAVHSLRKAQSLYVTRQQEYEKVREQANKLEADMLSQSSSGISALNKVDKRRKLEEEAMHKAAEAETTYKACVAEANCRQQELEKTKADLLARIRDQIYQCDQVIKLATIEYFHLLHTVSTPIPIQYHTLSETTKQYECGVQFQEFVKRLPVNASNTTNTEPFAFEPFYTTREIDSRKTSTQSTGSSGPQSQEGSPQLTSPRKDRYRAPVKAWSPGLVMGSDTDSASGSSKSVDSSPSSSPHPTGHRKLVAAGSLEGLDDREDTDQHRDLLSLPGADGGDLRGILKPHGRRRNTTFGVDFQEQVEHCRSAVPPIITKCLKEIERRGLHQEGIYRKSGVKSKVEGLCQRFEKDPDSVDLNEENHNVISNVLKLYLRQLPEPLLTFKSYQFFIRIAKEHMAGLFDLEETVNHLADVVSKLPYSNFKTSAIIMHHLHRIASNFSTNQMTSSNLGIVFGPTLLRPLEGASSLAYLVDMPHQTKAVELLIANVKDIFGPDTEYELIPGETPVEKIGDGKSPNKATPSPQSTSTQPTQSEKQDSTEKKDKGSEKQPMKSESSPAPEKPVEHLLQAASEEGEPDQKSSDADFVLPGSAHCDKKASPSVTISDDEDEGDVDIQSDDELPETLLPDDSQPPNTKQAKPTVSCQQDKGKASGGPAELGTINAPKPSSKSGKPSPPQLLKLASQLLSPGSSRKMAVPTINIIDSSPVGEISVQSRFPADTDKAKKPGALQPKSSSSNAQSLLKSVGPSIQSSIQSFMLATAKSFGSNGSGNKSSKADVNNSSQDSSSKACQSPGVLSRQSSGSPSSSPNVSRQNSSSPSMSPTPQSPTLPRFDRSSPTPTSPVIARSSTSPPNKPPPPSPSISRSPEKTPPSPPVFIRRTTASATKPSPPSPIFTRHKTSEKNSPQSHSLPSLSSSSKPPTPPSPSLSNKLASSSKSTPPSPTLANKLSSSAKSSPPTFAKGTLSEKSVPASPSLARGVASMRSIPSPTLSRHAVSESVIKSRPVSPGVTRQSVVSKPAPSLSSSWSARTWAAEPCQSSTSLSGQPPPKSPSRPLDPRHALTETDTLSVSGPTVKPRSSPTLSRQQAVQSDDGDLKPPFTPTPPRFSPALLRHSMSLQSSLPTSYGLRKTSPSPTLSRKSLSLSDHTTGKTGRISPRPLSSPLLLRQTAITPPLASFQSLRDTAITGDKLFCSRSDHFKNLTIKEKPEPNNHFGESEQKARMSLSPDKRAVSDPSLGRASLSEDFVPNTPSYDYESCQTLSFEADDTSGNVSMERPETSSRSMESSKSDQSSLSFSSHSSASDSDISSAANSDMSPEFRKKLISLPRQRVHLLSGTGFPDFSPILPRQKDFNIKKADSTPSLPCAAYPLSGNLSAMLSAPKGTCQGTLSQIDGRYNSVPRKSKSFEFQSITDSLCASSKDTELGLSSGVSSPQLSGTGQGCRPAHARPSVMPSGPRATCTYDALDPSSSTKCQSEALSNPSIASPSSQSLTCVLPSDTPSLQAKSMPPCKEGLLPAAEMTVIQTSTALKVCSNPSLLSSPLKAKVLSPTPMSPSTIKQTDPSSSESPPLASPTPVPPNSPAVTQRLVGSTNGDQSSATCTSPSHCNKDTLIIDTEPCKAEVTDGSLSPKLSHIPMLKTPPKTPPSPRDTHIPVPKTPPTSGRITPTPPPKTPPSPKTPPPYKTPSTPKSPPPSKTPTSPKTLPFSKSPPPVSPKTYPSNKNPGCLETPPVSTKATKSENATQVATPPSITQTPPPRPPQTLPAVPPSKAVLPDTTPAVSVPSLPLVPAVKDAKTRTARTTVKTTKSASREPVKVVKGPSGIVMGKAAIMPGGRGAMHRSISAGGASGTANGKSSPIPPTTKHPVKAGSCVGTSGSGCVSPTPQTTGRRTPTTVTTDKKPPTGSASGIMSGRKTPTSTVTVAASGRKTPTGSTSSGSSSGRKTPVTTVTSSSSKSEKMSCSTCGRRKNSAAKSVSDASQPVMLTAYRRASTGTSGVISLGEPVPQESPHTCKSPETKDCPKKDNKGAGRKVAGKTAGSGTKKEKLPPFV